MQTTTMTLKFTQPQMRDAAMRQAGLNPQAMAMKPGTRRERDRKLALKRGHVKHKARCWE